MSDDPDMATRAIPMTIFNFPVWGGHRQGARLHAGAASRQEATQLPRGGRFEILLDCGNVDEI